MPESLQDDPWVVFVSCADADLPYLLTGYRDLLRACERVSSRPVVLAPAITPVDKGLSEWPGVRSTVIWRSGEITALSEVDRRGRRHNEILAQGPAPTCGDLLIHAVSDLWRNHEKSLTGVSDSPHDSADNPADAGQVEGMAFIDQSGKHAVRHRDVRLFYAIWLGRASNDKVNGVLGKFWNSLLDLVSEPRGRHLFIRTLGASDGLTDVGRLCHGEDHGLRGLRKFSGRPHPKVHGAFNTKRVFRGVSDLLERDLQTLEQLGRAPTRIDVVFILGRTPGDDVDTLRSLCEQHPEIVVTWVYAPLFERQQLSQGLTAIGNVLDPGELSNDDRFSSVNFKAALGFRSAAH